MFRTQPPANPEHAEILQYIRSLSDAKTSNDTKQAILATLGGLLESYSGKPENQRNINFFREANGIPLLCNMFKIKHEGITFLSFLALGQMICVDCDTRLLNQNAIREAGGIPLFIASLQGGDEDLAGIVPGILSDLFAENSINREILIKAGVIQFLVSSLRNPGKNAGVFLSLLVDLLNNKKEQNMMRAAGGLAVCVNLLRVNKITRDIKDSIITPIIRMFELLVSDEENRQAIYRASGVVVLLELLKKTTTERIIFGNIVAVLKSLSVSDYCQEAMLAAGVIPLLEDIIRTNNPSSSHEANGLLRVLTKKDQVVPDRTQSIAILPPNPASAATPTIAMSSEEVSTLRAMIADYQAREPVSLDKMVIKLDAIQRRLASNERQQLSGEQHEYLEKQIQQDKKEKEYLKELLEMARNPRYTEHYRYYQAFQKHFYALMAGALSVRSDQVDLRRGVFASMTSWVGDIIAAHVPPATILVTPAVMAVEYAENRGRHRELSAMIDLTITTSNAERLGEMVARFLVRVHVNASISMPNLSDALLQKLVKEQCTKILKALVARRTPLSLDGTTPDEPVAQELCQIVLGQERTCDLRPLVEPEVYESGFVQSPICVTAQAVPVDNIKSEQDDLALRLAAVEGRLEKAATVDAVKGIQQAVNKLALKLPAKSQASSTRESAGVKRTGALILMAKKETPYLDDAAVSAHVRMQHGLHEGLGVMGETLLGHEEKLGSLDSRTETLFSYNQKSHQIRTKRTNFEEQQTQLCRALQKALQTAEVEHRPESNRHTQSLCQSLKNAARGNYAISISALTALIDHLDTETHAAPLKRNSLDSCILRALKTALASSAPEWNEIFESTKLDAHEMTAVKKPSGYAFKLFPHGQRKVMDRAQERDRCRNALIIMKTHIEVVTQKLYQDERALAITMGLH